jgi:hypothetical protein
MTPWLIVTISRVYSTIYVAFILPNWTILFSIADMMHRFSKDSGFSDIGAIWI